MMPLLMAKPGEVNFIKRIGGNQETKQFLETLGFVPGSQVVVVNELAGNLIVNIKEARVAIGRDMASKIMI